MKILAIGNSFSQDATALVELLSPDLYIRNLYIGGCSLERHCAMAQNDEAGYDYEHIGVRESKTPVSIKEALLRQPWDVVTVQQVSGLSGIENSYLPYLDDLLTYIRRFSGAKIVFHRTWAYETGSGNPSFANYSKNRHLMWNAIKETTDRLCAARDLPVLPVGDLIAALRKHPLFDVEKGGVSLCRDGYHLSLGYGRLAAAAVWVRFFTGQTPAFLTRKDLSDGALLIRKELEKLFQ